MSALSYKKAPPISSKPAAYFAIEVGYSSGFRGRRLVEVVRSGPRSYFVKVSLNNEEEESRKFESWHKAFDCFRITCWFHSDVTLESIKP